MTVIPVTTGLASDVAIDGEGYFMVRDAASGVCYATRRGDFQLDMYGNLVTGGGLRVQGFNTPALTTLGDVEIHTAIPAPIMSFTIHPDGTVWAILAWGQELVTGQILLLRFQAPEKMARVARNIYALTPAAQPSPLGVPGTAGLGALMPHTLDMTPEPVRLTLRPSATQTGPLTQGVLTPTGLRSDLGIVGPGFFLVRNTNTSELFATRAGHFLKDGNGYLVTYAGLRVQGYTDPDLTVPGDVRIDTSGSPSQASLMQFTVETDGTIFVTQSDGTYFRRGQLFLYTFDHPGVLTPTNFGCYAGVSQATPRRLAAGPGIYDPGIRSGQLELINVADDQLALRRTLNLEQQGPITRNSVATSLAISGNGYFLLRNPTSGTGCVTRNGSFHLDPAGYLVSADGLRVQGFADANRTTVGDLQVDGTSRPPSADPLATVSRFYFSADGMLIIVLSDGTAYVRGQVLLQYFGEPYRLAANKRGVCTNLPQAKPWPRLEIPGCSGLGMIVGGAYEHRPIATKLVRPSRHSPRLGITGEPGMNWVIEATTNFVTWSAIGRITNTPEEAEFCDEQRVPQPQRFYRVVASPGPPHHDNHQVQTWQLGNPPRQNPWERFKPHGRTHLLGEAGEERLLPTTQLN